MKLLKGGWAAKRFQGPALPWAGLLLVLLAVSALGVELLVKGLPANHNLYGDAKARWTINEYADLECPFCKVYTPRLKRWIDSHPNVNLVWRHLPCRCMARRPPPGSPGGVRGDPRRRQSLLERYRCDLRPVGRQRGRTAWRHIGLS
ncbi:DsbA family protein [Pseudomonas aeruginosa]|nr:DsbA family protein [Pseudomonas aeruginosa]